MPKPRRNFFAKAVTRLRTKFIPSKKLYSRKENGGAETIDYWVKENTEYLED